MNMKIACIYHSIDLDGWMSAAIVKYWHIKYLNSISNKITDTNTLDFIGYNYGQPIPDLSEYDKVIMCDISFPKEELLKINTPNDRLIWIDHHVSALKEFYESFDTIEATNKFFKGLRNTKFAACELTWKYFFPNEEMPEIVRLLGRYDCFGHKGTNEEQKVLEFQYGVRQCISNYTEAYNYLIDEGMNFKNPEINTLNIIYEKGKTIYQYLCTEAKQSYKNGFPIRFVIPHPEYIGEGQYKIVKFICVNKERFNPINFGINYHKDEYDGAACFYFDGTTYNFSLYNDNGEVDCSQIAKQYGGGGHRGAAGFRIKDLTEIL